MKRIIGIIGIFFILINLLCGCLLFDNTKKSTVFIIQSDDCQNIRTIQKSMENSFDELGYKGKIEIVNKNAKGNSEKLARYFNNAKENRASLIIAVGTDTAIAAKEADLSIPVVFIEVAYPAENKIVSSFDITNENITGIACNIPVDKVFELAFGIDKNTDNVTLIYDSSDNTSLNDINKAKGICELIGLKYNTVTIDEKEETLNKCKNAMKGTDFIYIPYNEKSLELISDLSYLAKMHGIPIYSNSIKMVKNGAFASVEVNYNSLGQQAAQMVVRILNGVKVESTNVENAKEYITYINCDTAEMLDIDIPDSLKNSYIPVSSD